MAFCNSCGAALSPDTKICNQCGTAVAGATPTPATTPAPPTGGSSTAKVILIVVAALVVFGIAGVAAIGFVGYHFAKNSHVTQEGERVKVDTPFGTFSANDPEQAAKDLGVEIYPGAQVLKSGSASATFGDVHTVAANFESSDPVDKVCAFYKSQLPSATVKASEQNRCTIVSTDEKNTITINVEATGDTTKFQIASVSKKPASSN
jgi:hypothetical protein